MVSTAPAMCDLAAAQLISSSFNAPRYVERDINWQSATHASAMQWLLQGSSENPFCLTCSLL